MNPLSLELENFMAFRKERLDLNGRDVFALTGPTGSGKSTLLDAMIFALYGQTPRMGSQGLRSLITQDIEHPMLKARVEFCFLQNGREYRVIRQIGQGSSSHRAEAWSRQPGDSEWKNTDFTGSVREFEKWISALLGMDYEAFTRVIVLPQGSFDSFLRKDQPRARRELMMRLNRLEIYDQILKSAQEQENERSQALNVLSGQLTQLSQASPERIEELDITIGQLEGLCEQESGQVSNLGQKLKQAERLWELQAEQMQSEVRLQELVSRQPEIDALSRRHTRGEQLRLLDPLLDHERQLADDAAEQARRRQGLSQLETTQAEEEQTLTTRQQAHEDRLAGRDELQKRQETLIALGPEVEQAAALSAKLKKLAAGIETLRQQEQQQQAQLQGCDSEQESGQQALSQAQTQLIQLQIDPSRLQTLQSHLPELRLLSKKLQPEFEKLELECQQQSEALTQKQLAIEAAREAQVQLVAALTKAGLEVETQQSRLQQRERETLAETLRADLHPGDDCPVCQQRVAVLPEAGPGTDLDEIKKDLAAARKSFDKLEAELRKAEKAAGQLEGQLEQMQQALTGAQQRHEAARHELATTQARLSAQLGDSLALSDLEQELSRLTEAHARHEALQAGIRELEQTQQALILKRERASQALAQIQQQLLSEQGRLAEEQTELTTLEQKLAQVLATDKDFAQVLKRERDGLQSKLTALDAEAKALAEAWQRWREQEASRKSQLSQLTADAEKLSERQAQHQRQLNAALQELELPDLAAAKAARVAPETLKRWKADIQQHDQETEVCRRNLERLSEEMQGQRISEQDLSLLRLENASLTQTYQEHLQQLSVARRDRVEVQRQLDAAGELLKQQQALEQERKLYSQIAEDLRSGSLPDFVYHRIMERVIDQGSAELMSLSQERYCFAIEEEELVVLDAWNANQSRSLKTLSGGESFMASLALALALNEYLSAGTHLGSLFIDEGFGTLDPESLDQAAEAIEKLQTRGKCIGVITHIPELAERFETRIRVRKSEQGASLELI